MSNLSPTHRLRPARVADLDLVLRWSPDAEAVRLWAGPNLGYPVDPARLWAEIHKAPGTAFTLCTVAAAEIVGFGQVMHREADFAHLARIIISPTHRGEGLGRTLCRELMQVAPTFLPVRWCSLYVYPENVRAFALYRSLGFAETRRERGFIRMEAPLDVAR